eukprot:6097845-Amphidinium_carterae.1
MCVRMSTAVVGPECWHNIEKNGKGKSYRIRETAWLVPFCMAVIETCRHAKVEVVVVGFSRGACRGVTTISRLPPSLSFDKAFVIGWYPWGEQTQEGLVQLATAALASTPSLYMLNKAFDEWFVEKYAEPFVHRIQQSGMGRYGHM